MTDQREISWNLKRIDMGWALPFKAAWPLRLWGVRHARVAYHSVMMGRHVSMFASVGIGVGVPAEYDLWVLYAIQRGWA